MNVFTFTGNLGRDCEMRTTQGGTQICTFAVAVKSGYGERAKTNWVKCDMFGKKAEGRLPEFLTKGAQVAVSGELSLDEWEKDGQKNSTLKCNVSELSLIGGKPSESKPAPKPAPQSGGGGDFDQDIPFNRVHQWA